MGGSNRGLMILTIISALLMLAAAFGALMAAPSAVGLTPKRRLRSASSTSTCLSPGSACWPSA